MFEYKIVNPRKLRWVRRFDRCAGPAIGLINEYRGRAAWQPPAPGTAPKILLLRTAYLGDVILALPAVEALRRHYPRAKITLLTSAVAAELLAPDPRVDQLLVCEPPWFYPRSWGGFLGRYPELKQRLQAESFDLGIDLRGDFRDIGFFLWLPDLRGRVSYGSGGGARMLDLVVPLPEIKHKAYFHQDLVRALGIEAPIPCRPTVYLPEAARARVSALLDECGMGQDAGPIGVHPGARTELKRWPGERFAAAARELAARSGRRVLVLGSAREERLAAEVAAALGPDLPGGPALNLAGRLSIVELAALIERLGLLLCNDSAPLHLASAFDTPVVAVFGPSKPRETGPLGSRGRVAVAPAGCRPGCDEACCTQAKERHCLLAVGVQEVVSLAEETLGNN